MKWSRNISRKPNLQRRDVEDAMENLHRSGTENNDNNDTEREIKKMFIQEDVLVEVDMNEEEKKIIVNEDENQDPSNNKSQIKKDFLLNLDDNKKKVFDDLNSVLTLTSPGWIGAREEAEVNDDEKESVDPNLSLINVAKNSLPLFSEDLIRVRTQIVLLLLNNQEKDSIINSQFGGDLSLDQKLLTVNEVIEHFESWTSEVFSSWSRLSVMREELQQGLNSTQDTFSDLYNSFDLLEKKMVLDFKAEMSTIVMNYVSLISALRDIKEDIEDNEDHPELNMYV